MSVTGMNAGDIILINNGTWYNIFLQNRFAKNHLLTLPMLR